MSIHTICPNGHTYPLEYRPRDWPHGAPDCPICFEEWMIEHRKTHKGMSTVFCHECGERESMETKMNECKQCKSTILPKKADYCIFCARILSQKTFKEIMAVHRRRINYGN